MAVRPAVVTLLLIALGATANAQVDPSSPAGHYRDRAGPDVAAELLLTPDGRFQFFLAAGSLDARAEGRWTRDGRTVILNTEPRPTPPQFTAGPVSRTAEHPISILVNWPDGNGIAGIDVELGLGDGSSVTGYTQDYGWQPAEGERVEAPRWVQLSAVIHGVAPQRFPLDAATGNVFAFTLIPNDMGIFDFRDTPVEITPTG